MCLLYCAYIFITRCNPFAGVEVSLSVHLSDGLYSNYMVKFCLDWLLFPSVC